MATACPAGDRLSPTPGRVRFPQSTRTPRRSNETPMARSPFRRFILVGGALAVAAARAYVKREGVRQLLPGTSSDAPPPSHRPPPPAPSNYDAPGPPANTATPVPAPDAVVLPDPARSDPVEEFPVQGDNPQEAAPAGAASAARAGGGRRRPGGGRAAGGQRVGRGAGPPGRAGADRRDRGGAGRGRRGRRDR